MKRYTTLLGGLLLASGLAVADDKSKAPEFSELDTNRDGAVPEEEVRDHQDIVAHFQDADVDSDGLLTRSEFSMLKQEIEEAE